MAKPDPRQTAVALAYQTGDLAPKVVAKGRGLIADEIHTGSAVARRRKAMAIYGMMVGTLQLARAANDRKLSNEMLESAIEGALALAGER